MKNLGLILASVGIAAGAIYAGTRLFTRKTLGTLNKTKREGKYTDEKEGENEELHSSISKSYVYIADYVI
jgi:hypothetical protein